MACVKKKLEVRHHTENLFYSKTTRASGTRFCDGQFLMIGVTGRLQAFNEGLFSRFAKL